MIANQSIYTPLQSRLAGAFGTGTTTAVLCEGCGRMHFTSADGHGDFDEGELEELQKSEKENPDKFVEHVEFDCIDWFREGGKQLVIGCDCGKAEAFAAAIEARAEILTDYLGRYWTDKKKAAESRAAEAGKNLKALQEQKS